MTDDILSHLPTRLKDARRAQGLSLDAVAKLSGVSRSMVSQIERGESSPTIATLLNLTQALKVDFAGLLGGPDASPQIEVLRRDALPSIHKHGDRCRILILSAPEDAGTFELYRLEFDHGGSLDSQPHGRGTRELLTVLSGTLQVSSGDDHSEIAMGDTARYPADVPHSISAPHGPATAILAVQGG